MIKKNLFLLICLSLINPAFGEEIGNKEAATTTDKDKLISEIQAKLPANIKIEPAQLDKLLENISSDLNAQNIVDTLIADPSILEKLNTEETPANANNDLAQKTDIAATNVSPENNANIQVDPAAANPIPVAEIPLLNDVSADTFQKMSDYERNNQLLKLESEQEKLKADLARLKAERVKYENMANGVAVPATPNNPTPAVNTPPPPAPKTEEAVDTTATTEENTEASNEDEQEDDGPNISESGKNIDDAASEEAPENKPSNSNSDSDDKSNFSVESTYTIKEILGTEGNLIATLQDINNSKKIKAKIGTKLKNGYVVSSISYEEGVTFEKAGKQQMLSFTPAEETE